MKGFLISLVVGSLAVVGGVAFAAKKGISLPALPSFKAPQIAIGKPVSTPPGEVMGAQTTSTASNVGEKLAGIGNTVAKLASAVGLEAVKTTQVVVNNVTTTPSSQADVINMANVVHDISSRVESIPGSLVSQAKVEYCKQVLQAATASAEKK